MASLYGLNYSPDSIRIPIVDYIHNALIEKINDDTQNLIAQVRKWHGNHIESSNYLVGYEKLVIETPSFLGLVLTKCETKDKFLTTAIELRDNPNISKFRKMLTEYDELVRTKGRDTDKAIKIRKDMKRVFDTEKGEESLGMAEAKIDKWKTAIEGAAFGMNIVNQEFGTMLSSLATAMGFVKPAYQLFNYLSNPRIMLLHDLKKRLSHVIRINKDIKEIFKSNLSSQEISKLTKLKALNENMLAENYFP